MNKKLHLQGNMTVGLGLTINKDRSDYRLIFFKEHIPIAEVYYHPAVKEYVVESLEAAFKVATLKEIFAFMNIPVFRMYRRWCQNRIRRIK